MNVVDDGHVYELWQLGSDEPQTLKFIKRSGGAVHYDEEWPGVQTQEVLRALIDRTKYLNDIIPCDESEDAIHYLRMALFLYEVRAYRRKTQELNKREPKHDDSERSRWWLDHPYRDVPFSEFEIEMLPIGSDGHINTSQ